MRTPFPWRLVKFASAAALLVLPLLVLLGSRTQSEKPALPSPLSPEDYRLISPRSYRLLLDQPHACRDRSPALLLLVPVAPRDAAARRAVRATWGSSGGDTLTLFFTGVRPGEDWGSLLQEESRQHEDIIQMDFVDSYHNLTVKTLMMMSWVASHCPNASYAMKVDADIFVNIFYLLELLGSYPRRGFITGSVITDGRPRRDPNSKWFLSEEQYPDDAFPPYVSGAGYVFSADLAQRISGVSRYVRAIPMEDVYVGLCLRLLGVRPVYSQRLLGLRNLFEIRKLEYDRCSFARRVIVNGFEPTELQEVWKDFSTGYSSC
ncbi:beta-1,3-galactosyltransferase 1-like [Salarias fasciatus]|uniref:beta-1,3-galactosyltransferase 1-like n=1 Tax=Salarias fasciatus TaxID=181472 RepID=UPI00117650F6|nr:beta-1,3-galactosyltransferase 1-like [Salarias fasciatus]XP_029961655.1 beta-1,3-galactosyltransferase 1-like [Salarias fasciatus]